MQAERWAEAIGREGEPETPDEVTARDALEATLDTIRSRPKSKRPADSDLRKFARVASRTGYPLEAALPRYLQDRGEGNPYDNEPLARRP